MIRIIVALALLCAAIPAHADPVSIIGLAASYFIGSQALYYAVTIGLTLYGGYRANRAAKKAAAAAKNAYNAGLQDRMTTAIADSPARRIVYGAGLYGGDVVAMFTTDKTNEDGSIKKDGYKHLVIVCAAHRVKAIKDLRIAGYMAGATATSGWAAASVFTQAGDFYKSQQYAGTARNVTLPSITVNRIVGSGTFGPQIISITAQQGDSVVRRVPDGGWTLSGYNLTLPNTVDGVVIDATYTWVVAYSFGGTQALSKVYVSKFLGTSTQTVDAYLNGLLPSYWTSNDRLRGLAGAVVTLDLTEPLFQSGIPEILFDLEGRDEIYDPRDGTYKYTTNPALIVDDWLRQEWGFGVVPNTTWTIAAANACDVSTAYFESGVAKTGPRYTCNGSFTTADDKERVLADLLNSMCGKVINSADWRILAGAWTPPVRTIVDGDDMGPLQILQAGQSIDDLFNGVRGRYIPAGQSSPVDINPPYKNSTFVAADGQELWETIDLPFVDTSYRAVQIARVLTEVNRNGLMVGYPAKLKHWDLEVGQRVALTNAEYGFSAKTFLLLNWEFTVEGAVLLQMIEDDAAAYDLGDASVADPTPNTNLPNPNVVQKPTGVTTAASTAELLRLQDGTIVPQVRVNWTSNDSYMQGGSFEVSWEAFIEDPGTIHTVTVDGAVREVLLQGVKEYQTVMVKIVAVNVLGRRSDPVFATQIVYGKSTLPSAVTGLSAVQIGDTLRINRNPSTDLDWDYSVYEYALGPSYTTFVPISGVSDRRGADWANPVIGALRIRARDVDTSGNVGPASTYDITTTPMSGQGDALNSDPYIENSSLWDLYGDSQAPLFKNDNTAPNSKGVYYISAQPGGTNQYAFQKDRIPVDPTRIYNLAANLLVTTGNTRDIYIVVRMFRNDGSELTGADTGWGGAYAGYVYGASTTPANTWTIQGADFGAGTGRAIPADVTYVRVGVWFQYAGTGSGTVYQAAQYFRLTDVTSARQALATAYTAIANAATAQATADGKIDSFYQPTAPTTFSNGDIWFDTDDGNKQYVAVSGAWTLARDTGIGQAITAAAGAQATADGKITTLYAATAPGGSHALGDLWFNTTDKRVYRWDGGAWVVQRAVGAGDIGTGELANQAATAVTQDTIDLTGTTVPVGSSNTTLREVVVTPTVDCTIEFSARLDGSCNFDNGAQMWWAFAVGAGSEATLANFIPEGVTGTYYSGVGSCLVSFPITAGSTVYFRLKGGRFASPGTSPRPGLSQMRITQVKR